MFLRIRGNGACPENSQAALLHLRGFRHVPCAPPRGAWTAAAAAAAPRDFVFPHFAIGILAPFVVEAQLAEAQPASAAPPPAAIAGHVGQLALAWKELWNVYDICYDEVRLLPDDYAATDTALSQLADSAAASGGAALPEDFALPRSRGGLGKLVVCTHYFSRTAWDAAAFDQTAVSAVAPAAAPTPAAVLVVDLSDLPQATCGSRLALSLAWAMGFASMQPDNVLLRTAAVLVRLPYSRVPSTLPPPTGAADAEKTYAAAYAQATDFLGEHIELVLDTCQRSTADGGRAIAQSSGLAKPSLPPTWRRATVAFVGNAESELQSSIAAVVAADPKLATARITVLRTDEHRSHPDAAPGGSEELALWSRLGEMVQLLVAPVRALIDGGEEPWDPYTAQERARLNFCPCCGDCAAHPAMEEEGADGECHHSHGHHGSGGAHSHHH